MLKRWELPLKREFLIPNAMKEVALLQHRWE